MTRNQRTLRIKVRGGKLKRNGQPDLRSVRPYGFIAIGRGGFGRKLKVYRPSNAEWNEFGRLKVWSELKKLASLYLEGGRFDTFQVGM